MEEKELFIKYGGKGIIYDPDYIEFYKQLQSEIILKYKLVGNFKARGKYEIDEMIKNELSSCPKLIQSENNNLIFAQIETKFKTFKFKVEIFPAITYSTAKLYLDESTDRTDEFKTIITVIGEFMDATSVNFLDSVKKAFNLCSEPFENIKEKLPKTLTLLEKLYSDEVFNTQLIELQSQIFIIDMIKRLEDCDEIGEFLIKEFWKQILQLEQYKPLSYEDKKTILDQLLKKYDVYPLLSQKFADINLLYRAYYLPLIKVKEKQKEQQQSIPKAVSQPSKDEKKATLKKTSPKKTVKKAVVKKKSAPKANKKSEKPKQKKDDDTNKKDLYYYYYLHGYSPITNNETKTEAKTQISESGINKTPSSTILSLYQNNALTNEVNKDLIDYISATQNKTKE